MGAAAKDEARLSQSPTMDSEKCLANVGSATEKQRVKQYSVYSGGSHW